MQDESDTHAITATQFRSSIRDVICDEPRAAFVHAFVRMAGRIVAGRIAMPSHRYAGHGHTQSSKSMKEWLRL